MEAIISDTFDRMVTNKLNRMCLSGRIILMKSLKFISRSGVGGWNESVQMHHNCVTGALRRLHNWYIDSGLNSLFRLITTESPCSAWLAFCKWNLSVTSKGPPMRTKYHVIIMAWSYEWGLTDFSRVMGTIKCIQSNHQIDPASLWIIC